MGDVGAGEFVVIALVAILLLGPNKLPSAIATGLSWVRLARAQMSSARAEIASAVDLDPRFTDGLQQSLRDVAALHPHRLASSIVRDAALGDPSRAGTATSPGGAHDLPAPSSIQDAST